MTTLTLPPPTAVLPPERPTGRRVVRPLTKAVRVVTSLLLYAAVLLFAALAVGPHVLGYRTITMLSGSMSPGIRPGDVIVDTLLPVTALRPGQIITYQVPTGDHRVVSHRIIAVTRTPAGVTSVRTKGDANASPDQWTAQLQGQQVWQVRKVIPRLGSLIGLLRGPNLMRLVLVSLLLLAADGLVKIWRRPTPADPAAA
jgi:signal peptidase